MQADDGGKDPLGNLMQADLKAAIKPLEEQLQKIAVNHNAQFVQIVVDKNGCSEIHTGIAARNRQELQDILVMILVGTLRRIAGGAIGKAKLKMAELKMAGGPLDN